jgi:hypothetical protein
VRRLVIFELVLSVLEVAQLLAQVADALDEVCELCVQLDGGQVVGTGQVGLQHRERLLEQVAAILGVDELV